MVLAYVSYGTDGGTYGFMSMPRDVRAFSLHEVVSDLRQSHLVVADVDAVRRRG